MPTQAEKKLAYEQWKEHCKRVQSITDTSVMARETPAERDRRVRRLLGNYAAFCEYYFPHYLTLRDKATGEVIRTIHNAPFHNAAAAKVKNTPDLKAVFQWPRGHAKSTHFDIFMPLWLMFRPKRLINFMVVVGKSEDSAIRLLSDIQAELEYNARIIADFGEQKSVGDWQEGEFTFQLSGVCYLGLSFRSGSFRSDAAVSCDFASRRVPFFSPGSSVSRRTISLSSAAQMASAHRPSFQARTNTSPRPMVRRAVPSVPVVIASTLQNSAMFRISMCTDAPGTGRFSPSTARTQSRFVSA